MASDYGIRTLLMTDVVGSTRLWAAHPGAMPDAVERMERLAEIAVAAEGGEVVKSRGEGDSLFCVLPHPPAAARAAAALVRALRDVPVAEGVGLKVRAAIHCGPANVRGSDVFGPLPNRCGRLREAAHGDQILLTGAARSQIGPADAIPLRDLGRHRLRDLDEPESVWQVVGAELPDDFPPLRSLTLLQNNLPIQYTSFVGRERLRRELAPGLGADRLTTLTGAGGCGKTRLSLQLGADTIEDFPDGVWFVELVQHSTETAIVRAVAEACGFRDLPDTTVPSDLADRLRGRERTLFILDNAEQALGPVGRFVADLSRLVPDLRFLVTSREPLRLRGERVHRVPPLTVPPAGCADPAGVGETEAGALFLDRARFHLPEFALSASNARAVTDVVRRLDGIPLCLEMAASHAGYLAVDQIAARLNDRFSLLNTDDADVTPRHRTMRATISWQYDTLEREESLLLQRLATFSGGFSLEAAEAVGGDPSMDPDRVLRNLRSLIDKSLVVATPDGSEMRYRILETIAQFASDQPEGATERAMPRLFDWALARAEGGYGAFYTPDHVAAIAQIAQIEGSINRALEFAFASGDRRVGRLALAMTRYWHHSGQYLRARTLIERALALCDERRVRFRLSNALAVFCDWLGDGAAAIEVLERELASPDLPTEGAASMVMNLGNAYVEQGETSKAKALYARAASLAHGSDARVGRLAKINLAQCMADLDEWEGAQALFEEMCRELGEEGDVARVAKCHIALASISRQNCDVPECLEHLRQAFEHLGSEMGAQMLMDVLLSVAWLAIQRGEPRLAAYFLGGHEVTAASTKTKVTARRRGLVDSLMASVRGHKAADVEGGFRDGRQATTDALSQRSGHFVVSLGDKP